MGSANILMAEAFVRSVVEGHDASHDWWHIHRVRNSALHLAAEEGISDPGELEVVHLAVLLHDVADHKYCATDDEAAAGQAALESFVFQELQGLSQQQRHAILHIIAHMGFSEELARQQQERQQSGGSGPGQQEQQEEPPLPRLQRLLAVVQDADRLDAIGAVGIARCLTFGGARGRVLYDPAVPPRDPGSLTKEAYQDKAVQQTTLNHFHEKLLLIKGLMRTEAGRRTAEGRHAFMENFLQQFEAEWEGRA